MDKILRMMSSSSSIPKNFVDHLYRALMDRGIHTYKADENIQSDELLQAIEDSKIYIIVFTKNYVSSSWRLDVLVEIMECHKMTGHTAYPVFYDVEPTEVRNQIGAVGEAFAKHEKEVTNQSWVAFFMNKKKAPLEKWTEASKQEDVAKKKGALKEAADLAGWELNTFDGHEAECIKDIVEKISLESKGMRGLRGAAKTTTARAVFDHLSGLKNLGMMLMLMVFIYYFY